MAEDQISQVLRDLFNIHIDDCQLITKFRKVYRRHFNFTNRLFAYFDGAGDNNKFIFFDMNGRGCEELRPDFPRIGDYVIANGGHFTQADLYIDDIDRIVDFQELVFLSDEDHYKDRLISHFRGPGKYIKRIGETLEFGSHHSKTRITIYQKGKYEGYAYDYNRFEIKMHDRQELHNFMSRLAAGEPLGFLVRERFASYLDFKVEGTEPKKERATIPAWSAFLENVQARKLGRKPKKKQDTKKLVSNLTRHNTNQRYELGDDMYLRALSPVLLNIPYESMEPVITRIQDEERTRKAIEEFDAGIGEGYQLALPFEEKKPRRRARKVKIQHESERVPIPLTDKPPFTVRVPSIMWKPMSGGVVI
jgi:hypothetical protein